MSGAQLSSRVPSGLRRGLPAYALAVLCFLIAIPAVQDLERLMHALGWILLALGVLITLATVFGGAGGAGDAEGSLPPSRD